MENKKRILLINHYAGSPEMGMEFRPYYFAREWEKRGHDVWIVAGDYSHLRKVNPQVKKDLQIDTIEGVKYIWLKTGDYQGNGVQRALTMFRFCWKLLKYSKKILQMIKPDTIITSSTYPLDTFPAQYLKKKSKAMLIHEAHDVWPATLVELGGMSKWHPFVMLLQIGENSAYKKSDKVVSLLPATKEHMMRHGMAEDKYVCIENGVVEEDWNNPKELPKEHIDSLERLKNSGEFIVGYVGGHALSNALMNLIQAAEKIKISNVHFVLIGDGVEKKKLMLYAEEHQIKNITFLPPISKKCIPKLKDYFTIGYCSAKDSPLYRYGISMNKIYDYMYMGIPVLLGFHANENLIEKYHCGLVSESTPERITETIEKFYSLDKSILNQMGESGKEAIERKYVFSKLAEDFLEVMK